MNVHRCLVLFLLLLFLFPIHAQETDFGLWSSVDIKKKFKHGLAVNLEEEYRMRDNSSTTDKFQTTIDVSWKPLSYLKGGVGYCRIYYYDGPADWEVRNRFIAYLVGYYKIDRFEFSLKEKFQQTNRVGVVATVNKNNPSTVLRSKFEANYNIKRLPFKPYASCEVFYALNEPDGVQFPSATKMVTEIRAAAGLEVSLLKNLDVQAGYLYSAGKDWSKVGLDLDGDNVWGYASDFTHALTIGLSYTF
jgi:opacity protein-like surface antigen